MIFRSRGMVESERKKRRLLPLSTRRCAAALFVIGIANPERGLAGR
jgi:hypothetical protein